MADSGYGRERYHFDGQSLPSLMRGVCATTPEGVDCRTGKLLKPQRPVYRYPKADSAVVRSKEWVRRYLSGMKAKRVMRKVG